MVHWQWRHKRTQLEPWWYFRQIQRRGQTTLAVKSPVATEASSVTPAAVMALTGGSGGNGGHTSGRDSAGVNGGIGGDVGGRDGTGDTGDRRGIGCHIGDRDDTRGSRRQTAGTWATTDEI